MGSSSAPVFAALVLRILSLSTTTDASSLRQACRVGDEKKPAQIRVTGPLEY